MIVNATVCVFRSLNNDQKRIDDFEDEEAECEELDKEDEESEEQTVKNRTENSISTASNQDLNYNFNDVDEEVDDNLTEKDSEHEEDIMNNLQTKMSNIRLRAAIIEEKSKENPCYENSEKKWKIFF
ncbi:unnamed protein product [Brachionus calyciflorus]|uniref:Uncharacterized protein n=1 Tax=Brachionus calyciflorus TaxID=104777 RepID=A0A813T5E8_9BILA|nr:unnamed protein product [Brachionus calyciflorus]